MFSSNFDLYSAYYDLLYANKKYAEEAAFVSRLLAEHGGSGRDILELGCGTGIHAVQMAERGYRVHGIDRSGEMLKAAWQKARGQPTDVASRLSFAEGDLRAFKVTENFDHVISLFDVISYLPDNPAMKQALGNIKSALKPGGLLIFDCWYGPAVYTQQPHVRTRRLTSGDADIVRIAEPVFYYGRNVIDVHYDIYAKNLATGEIKNFKEVHPMRCFFDAELDELLAQSGFERLFAMEWFTREVPSTDSWSVLFGYRLGAGA